MTAICPNRCKSKQFITVAHVMQDWKVDEHGEFLDCIDNSVQTSFKPDPGNIWTCFECEAEATFEQ